MLPKGLMQELDDDSSEVRQDDHKSNINSIDDQNLFGDNLIQIKNPIVPKRNSSVNVQKSGDFDNEMPFYAQNIE